MAKELKEGDKAPAFTLDADGGKSVALKDFAGQALDEGTGTNLMHQALDIGDANVVDHLELSFFAAGQGCLEWVPKRARRR